MANPNPDPIARLGVLDTTVGQLTANVTANNQFRQQLLVRLNNLRTAIGQIPNNAQQIQQLQQQNQQLQQQLHQIQQDLDDANQHIAHDTQEIQRLNQERITISTRIDAVNTEIANLIGNLVNNPTMIEITNLLAQIEGDVQGRGGPRGPPGIPVFPFGVRRGVGGKKNIKGGYIAKYAIPSLKKYTKRISRSKTSRSSRSSPNSRSSRSSRSSKRSSI